MTRRDFVKLAATGVVTATSTASSIGQAETRVALNRGVRPEAARDKISVLGIPFVTQEGKVEENVKAASEIIRKEMSKERVDLVVLPELFTCGYCAMDLSPYAEAPDGPSAKAFSELGRELDILIGFGFVEKTGEKRVHNSWMLTEPGAKPQIYRKTHLHQTHSGGNTNELEMFVPGQALEPFITRLGNIGVMICYDGCFVEVPRVLALKGADLILWPSRSGGYLAGQSLPHVRSLDNSITTVLVEGGQAGPYFHMDSWSAAYAENGSKIISQRNDSSAFRVAVDLAAGRKLRSSSDKGALSLYQPRRPDLYGVIAHKPGLYQ